MPFLFDLLLYGLGAVDGFESIENTQPITVTLSVNMEPLYGVILAFIFYKENEFLELPFYIGLSLILVSLLLQGLYVRNKVNLSKLKIPALKTRRRNQI